MKKTVLLIIPNLGLGGAQKVFMQQLKYLNEHYEVFGCVFNWDGAFLEDRDKRIFSLNVPAGSNTITKAWCFILRIIRLAKLKKKLRPNVSISHLEGADYVNILSTVGDKKICWIHGSKAHDGNITGIVGKLRMRLFIPLFYRRADRIVTVSRGLADELKYTLKVLDTYPTIVYNGFDLPRILHDAADPLPQTLEPLFTGSTVLITHCRLSPQKNLKALIAVFAEVHKGNRATRLLIVGDGEHYDSLIAFCQSRNLVVDTSTEVPSAAASVHFLGHQSNPYKFLKQSSLYIMTSDWEGFPLALCEAMACGLSVMAADCFTGPREILAPDLKAAQPVTQPYFALSGVVMPMVRYDDQDAVRLWAKLINEIVENRLQLNHEAGIERVRHFDIHKTMGETGKIIEELT